MVVYLCHDLSGIWKLVGQRTYVRNFGRITDGNEHLYDHMLELDRQLAGEFHDHCGDASPGSGSTADSRACRKRHRGFARG